MARTDVKFDFSMPALEAQGIILNPARAKFKDFFDSEKFRRKIGEYFKNMFESSNGGQWSISDSWAAWKKAHGYDERPNIMTGRLRSAMARPIDKAFPANVALRDSTENRMIWGANLSAFVDEYPKGLNNPFAFIDDSTAEEVAELALEYLIHLQKEIW